MKKATPGVMSRTNAVAVIAHEMLPGASIGKPHIQVIESFSVTTCGFVNA